jgi:hypothetical protein
MFVEALRSKVPDFWSGNSGKAQIAKQEAEIRGKVWGVTK